MLVNVFFFFFFFFLILVFLIKKKLQKNSNIKHLKLLSHLCDVITFFKNNNNVKSVKKPFCTKFVHINVMVLLSILIILHVYCFIKKYIYEGLVR